MGAKRALIVDDSKSARLFLARILEKYEIDVDNAENAEAAIEYLANHRPDVIFMDHLMPGMDGFQAVQAIKNNPRTATIPIMMYTSQEGELYLGQARALGAVGVLPKQIKPADVSKVLYQLHLLADRRSHVPAQLPTTQRDAERQAAPIDQSAGPMPGVTSQDADRERHCGSSSPSCAAHWLRASIPRRSASPRKFARCCSRHCRRRLPAGVAGSTSRCVQPPRTWGWIVACVALAIALVTHRFVVAAGRTDSGLARGGRRGCGRI